VKLTETCQESFHQEQGTATFNCNRRADHVGPHQVWTQETQDKVSGWRVRTSATAVGDNIPKWVATSDPP
jgi:hypothetical protein